MKKSWVLLLMTVLSTGLVACSSTPDVEETTPGPEVQAKMLTPSGGFYKLSSAADDLRSAETIREIRRTTGVSFNPKNYLCKNAKETEWRISRQVELQLELRELIEHLNSVKGPRRLTETQSYTLSKLQLCQPYLFDLQVISKLLQGYQLEELKTL